ncbi:hypothetical protein BDP27DRAFT_1362886, partial [Rhodocollybia butyracea]
MTAGKGTPEAYYKLYLSGNQWSKYKGIPATELTGKMLGSLLDPETQKYIAKHNDELITLPFKAFIARIRDHDLRNKRFPGDGSISIPAFALMSTKMRAAIVVDEQQAAFYHPSLDTTFFRSYYEWVHELDLNRRQQMSLASLPETQVKASLVPDHIRSRI